MLKIDADIYSVNNSSQRSDANYVLDNYLKLMKWSKHDNILDVGTGDGAVLNYEILPRIPQNFAKIVAMDVSEDMLRIARTKFQDNPKIEIICMDIAASIIPQEIRENFNHLFSFYCLHWVPEQKQAFRNLFSLLKPGADMLLTIIAKHVLYDVHEKMASLDEWAPFMYDVKKFIGPYHHSADPVKQMETLIKDVGFVDYKCDCIDRCFTFKDFSAFWEWSSAINPFIHRIPSDKLNLYEKEFRDKLMNSKYLGFENDSEGNVYDSFQMLVVFAVKPRNVS